MSQAQQLVEPRFLEALPDLIRIQAGRFPGTELLDLASPEGIVGRLIAEDVEDWTVYSAQPVASAPDNLETLDVDYEDLGFEDGQLAAVVGTWMADPIPHWSAAFLDELFRVLAPAGRVFLLFRAPSPRNPSAPRQLPAQAVRMLGEAGFEHAAERRMRLLPDGSQLVRLRAVKPE